MRLYSSFTSAKYKTEQAPIGQSEEKGKIFLVLNTGIVTNQDIVMNQRCLN